MVGRSPRVRRRRLGLELRKLRETASLTIEQVAGRLEVSGSKISRIENGQVSATPRDVRDIAELYGVTDQKIDNLMQLARETRQKPWWSQYSDLGLSFVEFEAEASTILMFSPMILPGLFQTPDYARTIVRGIRYDLPPEEIERRVDFRVKRQAHLAEESPPPQLWAVIDEAILHRMIGDPMIMHHQLKSLVETARLPHVTLQLLPFAGGAHAGLDGPFIIVRFSEPTDRDIVYFEHTGLDHYVDDPDAMSLYVSLFDHIRAAALKPDDSVELLSRRADELGGN
jgi:transcriptional regulator with XRE-family HTH domain